MNPSENIAWYRVVLQEVRLLFIKGLCIGFLIAAPVGPIGVLCITRTLNRGFVSGLLTGLGAATADGLYGFVAGFGVTFIASLLIEHQIWIRLAGGLFLVYLGLRYILAGPQLEQASIDSRGLAADYASTLALTLTNPMTIVSFGAVFASLGVGAVEHKYVAASALIAGVFLGSALWWLTLSLGVSLFRSRLSLNRIGIVNKIAGLIIVSFGLAALATLIV